MMSNKDLEKGDRVMLLQSTKWLMNIRNPLGVIGTVRGEDDEGWIYVRWDNREKNNYEGIHSDLVEVIEIKSNEDLWKGDRVMMLSSLRSYYQLGIVGTVDEIKKDTVLVKWDNGVNYSYIKEHNNLVIVAVE
jgi:hypothetical protein